MLWYSLEVPQWGTSNEYPQHMFSSRNKKNIDTFWLEKKTLIKSYVKTLTTYNSYPKYWDTLIAYHTSPKIWITPSVLLPADMFK